MLKLCSVNYERYTNILYKKKLMRFIQIKITREDLIISLIFLTTLQNPLRILFSSVHIMLEEVSFVKFGEMFFPKSIIKI